MPYLRHKPLATLCLLAPSILPLLPLRMVALTTQSKIVVPALLDINTATPDQLKALPGMGVVYAKRIIEGRPYTAKNQLITRGIIPHNTYECIKSRIFATRLSN